MEQLNNFTNTIETVYDRYKEQTLSDRLFKHKNIMKLVEKFKQNELCEVKIIGKSVEERDIFSIKIGKGKTVVLLWSQMHGNEATATPAIFDILNFLTANDENNLYRQKILDELTLYFVPMLNPDGAAVFTRQNALSIDINRDATAMQAPESRILKQIRDDVKADFGFNLHDQSIYYSAGDSKLPATISFLTPAFNHSKDINDTRIASMKVIVLMNKILQKRINGQVGRYYDDFMSNSFGDNMILWGSSSILIESGGYKNDPEKQYIRKMNYLSILSALYGISCNYINEIEYSDYFSIPVNKKDMLFDLLIRNVTIINRNNNYSVDIGIRREEVFNKENNSFTVFGRVEQVGDLEAYSAYIEIDAEGAVFKSKQQEIPTLNSAANFSLIDNSNEKQYEIVNGFVV